MPVHPMTASLEDLKSDALVQGLVGRKAQRILSSEMPCAMAWEMVFRSKVLRLNHSFEQGARHMTWTETFLRDEELLLSMNSTWCKSRSARLMT